MKFGAKALKRGTLIGVDDIVKSVKKQQIPKKEEDEKEAEESRISMVSCCTEREHVQQLRDIDDLLPDAVTRHSPLPPFFIHPGLSGIN